MAPSGEWNAHKMLDRYIHDYMQRKNFLTTAKIFAQEANVDAEPIVKDGPDGFLREWWHVFWGRYSLGMPNHLEAVEGSSAKVFCLVDFLKVKLTPGGSGAGASRARMAIQMMGNEQLNRFPAAANPDMNQQGGMQFLEHGGLPAGELNPNQELVSGDNLVHSDPSSSNASNFQLQTNAGDEQWTPGDNSVSQTGGPSHMSSTINGAPETSPRAGPPDMGTRNSATSTPWNGRLSAGISRIPSAIEYPVLNSFVPEPNQKSQFQTLIPHHQQDISSQAIGNKKKKISSFQGSTESFGDQMFPRNGLGGTDSQMTMRKTAEQKMTGPAGLSLEQKQNNRQSWKKLRERRKRQNSLKKDKVLVETKKSSDDDIESHFFPDNRNADIVSNSNNYLETHATACSFDKQNGFFFEEVASLDTCKGKVLCCHFSSDGKLLASAGDDKKVLLWDLSRYDSVESAEGHLDIITDIRFQPSSHVFATSSLDRTVQIWDPNSPTKPLGKLLGHSGQVNSLDFHPDGDLDLLCSCDSNDVIKLWSIDQFACKHTFKGATRQVRFQPRWGTLLAAALGNGINLFDYETNTLQYSLEGHVNEVKSICWDTSGKYMASVSEECARVWSIVYGGKCIQELQSKGSNFISCIFHPAYSNVLVIGSNQSLQLWNPIESNKTVTVPAHNGIADVLADCTQTKMIASACGKGIKLWK